MKTILIISPPFYSHLNPLLTISKTLQCSGRVRVVVATSSVFENHVRSAGCVFTPLEVSSNANTGIAEKTSQADKETQRLEEFFNATYRGAVPTLLTQAKHRRLDMLPDPQPIYQQLQHIHRTWQPSLYLIDQLNYAVTLALYALGYPFFTFCPGHPTYIPQDDQFFGVPYAFPTPIQLSSEELQPLRDLALKIEQEFTAVFNSFLERQAPQVLPVENAFRLTSSQAILFNYPDFGHLHRHRDKPSKWFSGHCFSPYPPLDEEWLGILRCNRDCFPKILISFGTFLSFRSDVIRKIISTLINSFPNGLFISAVGGRLSDYSEITDRRVILKDFIPQTALLPQMDLVIHHGGNNTFTETLFHAKPMAIFPFSSDQFSIAYDAERFGIAEILNPNDFQSNELAGKIDSLLEGKQTSPLEKWSKISQAHGAPFLADSILSLL